MIRSLSKKLPITGLRSMRSVGLRKRLILLAAAGILPLAAMSGIGLLALFQEQRDQAHRAGIEISRALATAVDAELRRSVSVLEALATSIDLDVLDTAAFYQRAQRVMQTRPQWRLIILAEPSGKAVLNTDYPYGAALPPVVEKGSFEKLVQTRQPAIGNLARGQLGAFAVPIRVPVERGGRLHYVLTAVLQPQAIVEVVKRQQLPPDWVISVFDASGSRVARSRSHEVFIGTQGAPELRELMDATPAESGSGMTHTLEGDRVYTAFARLPDIGWSVAIGIPPSVVEAGARRSLAAYGGGLLLSLALGIITVLVVARHITDPMAELRKAAQALGRGEPPHPPVTDVPEIQEVADALTAAAEERRRIEAEREHLLHREQQARAAAEGANRAKDEFLAMLGHELRNPLAAIAAGAHLLEHPRVDEKTRESAREIIAKQVKHLARLTDDLLDAARAVLGKIELRPRPLDLGELTAQTLATLRAAGRVHERRLHQQIEPVWVEADATRVGQVISNLIDNAVKYTAVGGTIRVSVKNEGGRAVLRVADDGIGMPPQLADTVFDLFVQGDRELDRRHGGLGVGLTLVRRIAELHGGSAGATSDGPGRGSEFIVTLPLTDQRAERRPAHAAQTERNGRHILVVEDNDDARETLCRLLEYSGHRVSSECDGAAGLARALAARPEVVLIDIGLPLLDGYQVAQSIRAAPDLRPRPYLIALTGYGLPEDRQRALDAGFDAHLVKPVEPEQLDELLAGAASVGL
jgi:signal transduction histidine kinase/ActR/RegA family two-component response regulator